MAYIDYEYFTSIYGEIPETDFNRLSWEASRKIDVYTSGIDGVRKLKIAFPTDEDSAEAVKRCVCKLIQVMQEIEEAETSARQASGYVETENGLKGKVISSVSAGNESISFAVGSNAGTKTIFDEAISNKAAQEQLFRDTIYDYLSGISDANGVNLLYMGRYPYWIEKE